MIIKFTQGLSRNKYVILKNSFMKHFQIRNNTVVAEIITELICFESEICICNWKLIPPRKNVCL